MTEHDSLKLISEAVTRVLKKPTEVPPDADLATMLDSLEGMSFFFEVEELSGRKLPDADLVKGGFLKVPTLIGFLRQAA